MSSDHFSTQSQEYATYRPTYPAALFDWLHSQCPESTLAWDCACGSGQATTALAQRFSSVVATDLSPSQLSHAPGIPNVEWKVAHAEDSGLPIASVDLVTVAQALHWFDLRRFWEEVNRVLKPGGVIAVWCYGILELEDPEIHRLCDQFYHETVGGYWPPEREIVEDGYRSLSFPYTEIDCPTFTLETHWSLAQLLGYFSSWSATTRYKADKGSDPVPELGEILQPLCPEQFKVAWPLSLRVGRKDRQQS